MLHMNSIDTQTNSDLCITWSLIHILLQIRSHIHNFPKSTNPESGLYSNGKITFSFPLQRFHCLNFFFQIITVHSTISKHDYRGWGQCCWHIFRNQWISSITWFAEKFGKVRNYCFFKFNFYLLPFIYWRIIKFAQVVLVCTVRTRWHFFLANYIFLNKNMLTIDWKICDGSFS